jgi:methionyl-tRNA formyltransferase
MVRVAFLGSPEPAAHCLRALAGAGHDVALVVTEADKRRGRGSGVSPTPVKRAALELDIAVTDRVNDVLGVGADLGIVVAFGRMIRPAVLDRLLMVNVHFSLLPRWRGAAPVERAILAGDERTGVCLMKLDDGLDTGPVYACAETPILPETTAPSLLATLSRLGAELLLDRLAGGVPGLGIPTPQEGEPTYAAKITPADLHIDWTRPAAVVERQVRIGRAWTTFRQRRLLVLGADAVGLEGHGAAMPAPGTVVGTAVATGDGWLDLSMVQPEGRHSQAAADWLRGARVGAGETLA